MRSLLSLIIISIFINCYATEPFKTTHHTFTHKHELLLNDGEIWIRESGQKYVWQLLNGVGLPFGDKFDSPVSVKEISADGNNLVALDDDNYLYLMKFDFMKFDSWTWKHKIGLPYKERVQIPGNARAWAVSHRGNVSKYYEDIAGEKWKIKVGVSTIYVLDSNGYEISYVDPWIQPNFNHKFMTPFNGRFIATNMSVSSSTIFVINKAGEMYTRLYDYDTAGENPFFSYTYQENPRKYLIKPRMLPAESWHKQPAIPGLFTDRITILQNGEGNAGRELRVEGIDKDGESGYYYKQIFESSWNFKIDNHEIKYSLIARRLRGGLGPKVTHNYDGSLVGGHGDDLPVQLVDFHHHANSGFFIFDIAGEKYHAKIYVRRLKYKKNGSIKMKGVIILPDSLTKSTNSSLKKAFKEVFYNKSFVSISLILNNDSIKISGRYDKLDMALDKK